MTASLVTINHTWKHRKAETLGLLVRRALEATAELGPPDIGLLATDSPVGGGVSAVDRAVKKHPELEEARRPFTHPGAATSIPALQNRGPEATLPLSTDLLLALADGVPRSLPFHQVVVDLSWPQPVGIRLGLYDQWWVSGRMRSSILSYAVEAESSSKQLPPPPAAVAALIAAFGKPMSTARLPTPQAGGPPKVPPAVAEAVQRHRAGLRQRIEQAGLPHVLERGGMGEPAGPMKPLLERTFGPAGYACKGASGTFSLRRRTLANHVVELHLDVGTWSHLFTGFLSVYGPDFRASVPLLVTPEGGQVPIRGPEGWRRIVENLAAVVKILEEGFVRDVEEVAGPAPTWFEAPSH